MRSRRYSWSARIGRCWEHVSYDIPILLKDFAPESAELNLLGPDLVVQTARPIFVQDGAVRVLRDSLKAKVNLYSTKTEAEEEPDQWNDPDPFLLRVFVVKPRSLLLAFLNASRLEVSRRAS